MPEIVPAPAKMLLDFIRSIEAPRGYGTIYGNNQDKLPVPLTSMTLDQVIAAQKSWSKRFGSSAAGGLQFMRDTLLRIKKETGVSGTSVLTAGFQDRLGYLLLLDRGYEGFIAGRISVTAFGKALAQEWASFPVLTACRGAHKALTRGDSYYKGDELNKALVAPERVEAKLQDVLELAGAVKARQQKTKAAPAALLAAVNDNPPPIAPAKIDPEKLDKPLMKSKTFWQWLLTAAGAPFLAFGGLDWRVQLAIVAVIVLFAIYAIKRRADIAKVYRDIKAEIGR
ncbi:glycoside hydrolase family 104 protein [Rhizobium leguminosarum]|uniref:hypothetical protein n=1 Tax=Rhizobium leguminosarum TaxID=384 RepID=UPI001C8FDAF6|nr:hypothetical protein [Rhizobium leguminosarum]MBY2992502.1 glycoside hydrolase family 104 protein [Rhizobium leguminosarum]